MGLFPEVAFCSPSSLPIFPMNAPRESAGYLQNADRRIDVKSSNQGKRKVLRSSILSLFNLGSLYRVDLTQARFPPLSRVQSSAPPRDVLVRWEERELIISIKGPCHKDFALLCQFCAEVIFHNLLPNAPVVITKVSSHIPKH